MNLTPFRHEASFFADLSDIRPTADIIKILLDAFQDYDLLPTTYQELQGPIASAVDRLRLVSRDTRWAIDFDLPRINLLENRVKSDDEEIGTVEQFTATASTFVERILALFPRKRAHRLALVSNDQAHDLSDDVLNGLYGSLFTPLPLYAKTPPISWTFRSVSRLEISFGDATDAANVISQVRRIETAPPATALGRSTGRLELLFDINTYQGNPDPRFGLEDLRSFFPEALSLRHSLLSQLLERYND